MPRSRSSAEREKAERAGRRAEAWAALFLQAKGYRIRERRFRTPVGEIDLIAERFGTTVFGEVKARASRKGEADPIEIVDRTFDAFGKEGAGALAAWMILSGNRDALNPILDSIHRLVDSLGEGHEDRPVHDVTLWLVLSALGDSLLGAEMAQALGLPAGKARELAREQLIAAAGLAKGEPRP